MKKVTAREMELHFAKEMELCFEKEGDDPVVYIIFNGKRIAKRYPGQNWINLEPGHTVTGSEPGTDYKTFTIDYDPKLTKAQS